MIILSTMKNRTTIPAFFLFSVVMLPSDIERGCSQSSDRSITYIVINDVLNVGSIPGMNSPIEAKLANGNGGVRITGESVGRRSHLGSRIYPKVQQPNFPNRGQNKSWQSARRALFAANKFDRQK